MWFYLLVLAASAAAPDCGPLEVIPPDDDLGIDLGGVLLPRGSIVVRRERVSCDGDAIEVRSVVDYYREADHPLTEVGDHACLPPGSLRTPQGTWTALGAAEKGPCGEGGRYLSDARIAALAPVRARYRDLYGEGGTFWVDDWGRVALPLVHYLDDDERVAEWIHEHLDTDEQREKAVDALGPLVDKVPVYAHFTGADAPRSDLWGEPWVVEELLQVAHDWFDFCSSAVKARRLPVQAGVAACTLQLGDLAYYRDVQPDPLGHKDHDGTCVDVRLFRDDGSHYEAFWNRPDDRPWQQGGYSQPLTRAFVRFLMARPHTGTVMFNDPQVPGPRRSSGHDDHVHACFVR